MTLRRPVWSLLVLLAGCGEGGGSAPADMRVIRDRGIRDFAGLPRADGEFNPDGDSPGDAGTMFIDGLLADDGGSFDQAIPDLGASDQGSPDLAVPDLLPAADLYVPPCAHTRAFGSASAEAGRALATDRWGGMVLAGDISGPVDFGGGVLTPSGTDVFLFRRDSAGGHVFSRVFGDAATQTGNGVALDAQENLFLLGTFGGQIDLGGGALVAAGGNDVFLAKLGATGNHLWSRRWGDAQEQGGVALAVDPRDGSAVIAGRFAGAIDFGAGPHASAGMNDVFLARLDASGGRLFSKAFGDAADQEPAAVAVDGSGAIFLAGSFSGAVDFGGGSLTSAGGADAFLAKFDADGNHLWSRRYGDAANQGINGLAVDPSSGAVVITGSLAGSADFGTGALTSAGGSDVFVARIAGDGSSGGWAYRYGDGLDQVGRAVTVDANGSPIVVGDLQGTINFGGGPVASLGGADLFALRLSAVGTYSGARRYGDGADQNAFAVAGGPNWSAIVVGTASGNVAVDSCFFSTQGQGDIFVAQLAL